MNCPKCGQSLPAGGEFCQYCGSRLAGASAPAENAAPASAPELAGKTCPFCKAPFMEGEAVVFCSHCEMPHHLECWKENGGCTTFGCTGNIGKIIGAEQKNAQSAPVATRRPAAPAAPRAVPYPQTKYPASSKAENEMISRADELVQTEKQAQYIVVEEDARRVLQGNVPVVIENTKLLKDKEGKLFLSCRFVSIADKSVRAMLVDVLCADVWRVNLQPVRDFQYLDLVAKRSVPFGENILIPIPDSNTRVVDVVVQKLMLADGTLVTHTEECVQIPVGKPLAQVLDGELIEEYQRITSNQALYVPASFAQAWVCTCGAVNRRDEEKCHVCGSVLNRLLDALNEEKLRENIEIAKQAQIEEEKRKRALEEATRAAREKEKQQRIERENQIRQQREKEAAERDQIAKDWAEKAAAEAADKKKRIRKTVVAAALAVAVLMAGGWVVLRSVRQLSQEPAETPVISSEEESHAEEAPVELAREERIYLEAEQLAAEGKYYEAATTFYTIKDYKDSWGRCFSLWGRITTRTTWDVNEDGTFSGYRSNKTRKETETWENVVASVIASNSLYGLTTEGKVLTASDMYPLDASDWADIVAISASDTFLVGIKADGTVLTRASKRMGNDYGQSDAEKWRDVIMIATSGYHTVGLKADGTVVAAGRNTVKQCEVGEWSEIINIAVSSSNTYGVKTDGTVVAVGSNKYNQLAATEWENIVKIVAAEHYPVGLKSDGLVVSTDPKHIISSVEVVDIYCPPSGSWVFGLEPNGEWTSLVYYTN